MTPEITCVKLITLHQLYKCCRSHFLNIYAPVTIKVHQAQVQRESLDNCSTKTMKAFRIARAIHRPPPMLCSTRLPSK
jgi:hypothetical protein